MPHRLHQNTWFQIFIFYSFFSIISPVLADDKPQSGDPVPVKPTPVREDGQTAKASFSNISGLEVEENMMEYRTGSEDQLKTKTPRVPKNPSVNQKRPQTPIQNPPQTPANPAPAQTSYKQPDIPYTNTDLHVDMGTLIDKEQTKRDPMRAYHAYAEVFHSGYTTEGHERLDD